MAIEASLNDIDFSIYCFSIVANASPLSMDLLYVWQFIYDTCKNCILAQGFAGNQRLLNIKTITQNEWAIAEEAKI